MITGAFPISDASHVSAVRRGASDLAHRLGFSETRTGQVALAVTELSTNILKHAQRGEVLVTECRAGESRGLEMLALDSGPGFPNVEQAMRDGHSTAGSLGHGLGSVQRNTDQFEIFSRPTRGAAALCRVWETPRSSFITATVPQFAIAGVCVAKPGEEVCGDAWAATIGVEKATVIVADGLGHGLLAAEAAWAALEAFARGPDLPPAAILGDVHAALRATRGAAVAVLSVVFDKDAVSFAGLGNIAASIVTDNARRSLISHNGTAGHSARTVQEFTYPVARGSTVIMHSDGLGTQWDPAEYPGLWSSDPAIVAGVLYRDFSRRRDDVTVLAGRLGARLQ